MYLEYYYYTKGCPLIGDKFTNDKAFKLFSYDWKLTLNLKFNKYKKYEIISFLLLKFLNSFQSKINIRLNKKYTLLICKNFSFFSFLTNFILLYLPNTLLTSSKINYFINVKHFNRLIWRIDYLFMTNEFEKLWELNDNQLNIIQNFKIELKFEKKFSNFNYQESCFRLIKFPLINSNKITNKC